MSTDHNAIYLDYNATTPLDAEVVEAMKPFLTEVFGNPSSNHYFGIRAKKAVEHAREQVASLFNCREEELIFTSGGTESNNMAIWGLAFSLQQKGRHIITSTIEHPAVSEVCDSLQEYGFEISRVGVDEYGLIRLDDLKKAIRPDTILVSIMHANNEVGTIQPIREISEICHGHGIVFHSDGAQSVGKIAADMNELGVDLYSLAGHKLYAPKGIGALYIRTGVEIKKFMHGADHEMNKRPGTENVLEIVGLGKACEIAKRDLEKNAAHMKAMRDRLCQIILDSVPEAKRNGHPELNLPNTASISFPGVEADTLISAMKDVAVSAGAACHTDKIDVSAVLEAMNVPLEYAMGTIRISTGRKTTEEEINTASKRIIETYKSLKGDFTPQAQTQDMGAVRLTSFTHGLGCACKIRPQDLELILKQMPRANDPRLLVGLDANDDATVYRITKDLALIQTVDFFTPIVDDPYMFGAIAAANSFSDIYAMGGQVLFALNIVGFPVKRLPMEVLNEILRGASDKAAEAGIHIAGGHSIEDTEPKYGLAVSGIVHPDQLWRNSGARKGDVLILTKALGTGIVSTALKRDLADDTHSLQAMQLMASLNKYPMEIMKDYPISSCTDITGFGLLGHLREMTKASKVDARLIFENIPLLDGIKGLLAAGAIPGGTINNLNFVSPYVHFSPRLSENDKLLLADAQTSGGLLFTVSSAYVDEIMNELKADSHCQPAIIGEIIGDGKGLIHV